MITGKQKAKSKIGRKIRIPFLSSLLANKKKKTVLMSSMGAVIVIVIAFQVAGATGNTTIRDIGIVAGILGAVFPPIMLNIAGNRRRDSIDRNLPVFLLSIVSAVQSGATIMRAIEDAADRDMGELTPQLKNLRANLSWGMSIEEVFDNFSKKVETILARRVAILLLTAVQSGGEIAATIDMIQKHVTEMQNIEKERKSSLQPYTYTIYISYVVFIAVIVLLVGNFFSQIAVVQNQLIEGSKTSNIPLGMFGALLGVDVSQLNSLMFNMALIEAVFGGIAAGKIGESSFIAGIKHVIVMIIIAVVAFAFVGVVKF